MLQHYLWIVFWLVTPIIWIAPGDSYGKYSIRARLSVMLALIGVLITINFLTGQSTAYDAGRLDGWRGGACDIVHSQHLNLKEYRWCDHYQQHQ